MTHDLLLPTSCQCYYSRRGWRGLQEGLSIGGVFLYTLSSEQTHLTHRTARLYPSFPTLALKCLRAFHNKYSRTVRPFPSRYSLIRQKDVDSNKPITTVLSLEFRNLKSSPSTPMKSYALQLLRNVRAARGQT